MTRSNRSIRNILMTVSAIAISMSSMQAIADDRPAIDTAEFPLFIAGKIPADLAAPRTPDVLDSISAEILDVAYAACGPRTVHDNVIRQIAQATKTTIAEPAQDDVAKARWISIVSMALSEERAALLARDIGARAASGAIAALCSINHNHMLVVAQGHFTSIFRVLAQKNEERTSQLDGATIALWPIIRRNERRVAEAYPSDHSNLTAASYPGAAIAQAFAEPLKSQRSLEVRRFYEPEEIDSDRTAFGLMLSTAAGQDPLFRSILEAPGQQNDERRAALQSFVIDMNWMTIPGIMKDALRNTRDKP
jgi:hypothetical protein